MSTLTATITKEIKYNHGDYDMFLNGQYVGSEASYHSAEVELDRLAFEQLDRARIEPEMLLSATALDGGSDQHEIAAEYAAALPTCVACHTNDHAASTLQPAFCTECVYAMFQGRKNRLDCRRDTLGERWTVCGASGDGPCYCEVVVIAAAPDHNLVTPDPAECPDTSAPQPVEELSACERYSTPPALALWGPPNPLCPKCSTQHDPILDCLVRCANCDKPHHIQRCPEVWRALTG